ncbi:nucleotidyltransferase substrate-binding family protein [Coprococcus sp. CAG:782]|nr:nucleotidyltransferase substrate-binding family protein [Coprococcus sp. CAG:782]
MDELEIFFKHLAILKGADFKRANENDIYRIGVVVQFNLTFELAWKALQAVLKQHGVEEAETGSPREILQLGYKVGFVNDQAAWLLMLKKRNVSVHIYNEDEIDELVILIRDSFIPEFTALEETLREKVAVEDTPQD